MTDDQNDSNQTWESEMSTEFDRRVRDLNEAPLSLDTVKGKAVSIRRKRRIAVAAGVLATAAVITPVALLSTGSTDDSGSVPAATQTPTAIDSPTDSPTATPAGPGFAYLTGGEYHRADGSVVELPGSTYEQAATVGDQVVAATQTDGNYSIDVIDGGAVLESYPSNGPFVTSDAGDLVAFVTRSGDLLTRWDGGQKVLTDGLDTTVVRPVAVTGDDCVTQCRVYLDFGDNSQDPTAVDQDGARSVPVPGAISIDAVTPGGDLVAAQTESTDFGSCSTVTTQPQGAEMLETCDYRFEQISSDGRYAIATDAYGDGFGPLYFVVLDLADGAEVARYALESGGIFDLRWLDDDTVVARVYDGAKWQVITQDLQSAGGELATVLGPTKGNDFEPTWRLTD